MSYNELRKGRFSELGREYFVTCTVMGRRNVFNEFQLARLMISELRSVEEEGTCFWLTWVVMPDHIHGLLSLSNSMSLSKVMQQLKGRRGRSVNAHMKASGTSLWQTGFYNHALRREEDRKDIARYIICNPVRAGLVTKVFDSPHWDAVYL